MAPTGMMPAAQYGRVASRPIDRLRFPPEADMRVNLRLKSLVSLSILIDDSDLWSNCVY